MRQSVFIFSILALFTAPPLSSAKPFSCSGGDILVENAGEDAAMICAVADRASDQLATCGLSVPAPVTIAVMPELAEQCLGLYHCGKNRIEILAHEAYAPLRAKGEASAFAAVSSKAFFESVIRHELAHAALDKMPCPFESCVVGQEYIAYTMQVRFLPDADKTAFKNAIPKKGPVSRDDLSRIMLAMAPETFARRAWLHLVAREEPCAFIRQIANGDVLLDRERR